MASMDHSQLMCSDELFDFECTSVCVKKSRVSKSAQYCVQCGKHLCISCLENHNEWHHGHRLVEPSKASDYKPRSTLTEHCPKHPQKILEHFCKDHDSIMCGVCAILEHRSCSNIVYIPESIKEIFKPSEVQDTIKDISSIEKGITKQENNFQSIVQQLQDDKKSCRKKISETGSTLVAMVKALEQASFDEVDATYESLVELEKCNMKECNEIKQDLQSTASSLSSQSKDDSQMFICLKMAQSKLKKASSMLENRQVSDVKHVDYNIDTRIQSSLARFQTLGVLGTKAASTGSSTNWQATIKKVTAVKRHSVALPTNDINNCDIVASCVLPNGNVVLADTGNKRLKCFLPNKGSIVCVCNMPEQLSGLCCVDSETVAATMEDRSFCLVSTQSNTIKGVFKPGHRCSGIAHSEGELFITDGHKTVFIYKTSGQLVRQFNVSQPGKKLTDLGDLVISQAKMLYVIDLHYGVRCFDTNGREIKTYSAPQVDGYRSVCMDPVFGMVVLGCWSRTVVQFGSDGKVLCELLTKAHELDNPRSVCVDSKNNKIYVTELGNTIVCANVQ